MPKSELLDVVWPGVVVEENNLQVQISSLRKLLGPQAIATPMHRTQRYFVEEWVYRFWRRGQFNVAILLLGASDAVAARTGRPLQRNAERLIAEARAALEQALPPHALARDLAIRAALTQGQLLASIAEALAKPVGDDR